MIAPWDINSVTPPQSLTNDILENDVFLQVRFISNSSYRADFGVFTMLNFRDVEVGISKGKIVGWQFVVILLVRTIHYHLPFC